MHLKWIISVIADAQEIAPWVVEPLLQITKASLSFNAKSWWKLVTID